MTSHDWLHLGFFAAGVFFVLGVQVVSVLVQSRIDKKGR